MVTNAVPTAYWEPGHNVPVFSYPTTPRTLQQTLLEAARCAEAGLRIDSFLLEPSAFLVQFSADLTQTTQGQVCVTDTRRLGTHLLIAYLAHKAHSMHRVLDLALVERTGRDPLP